MEGGEGTFYSGTPPGTVRQLSPPRSASMTSGALPYGEGREERDCINQK